MIIISNYTFLLINRINLINSNTNILDTDIQDTDIQNSDWQDTVLYNDNPLL